MERLALFLAISLFPLSVYAQNETYTKEQPQTIYINNEIPAEILRAYNEQADVITEMRLKIQELEQKVYYSTERLTNLEAEVWQLKSSRTDKSR